MEIKQSQPSLEETIRSYHEAKEQFLGGMEPEESLGVRKQLSFDKNISLRLNQIIKSYEAEVSYMEDELKNPDDA